MLGAHHLSHAPDGGDLSAVSLQRDAEVAHLCVHPGPQPLQSFVYVLYIIYHNLGSGQGGRLEICLWRVDRR